MRTVATFYIPAVLEWDRAGTEWRYSAWRVIVTDRADAFLVQYLLSVVRS